MLASEIKKGVVFAYEGKIYKVTDFQLSKRGRGASIMSTKLKNLESGAATDKKFNPNEVIERVQLIKKQMQYIYRSDGLYYFMDLENYEQKPIEYDLVKQALKYIKEEDTVEIVVWNDNIIDLELPLFVTLEVIECEPGIMGNSARAGDKNAVLSTGLQVRVPLFINKNDIVKIDTRDGSYVERIS